MTPGIPIFSPSHNDKSKFSTPSKNLSMLKNRMSPFACTKTLLTPLIHIVNVRPANPKVIKWPAYCCGPTHSSIKVLFSSRSPIAKGIANSKVYLCKRIKDSVIRKLYSGLSANSISVKKVINSFQTLLTCSLGIAPSF